MKTKTEPTTETTGPERRGVNRTIVAVANKNARIIWAMLRKGVEFQLAA